MTASERDLEHSLPALLGCTWTFLLCKSTMTVNKPCSSSAPLHLAITPLSAGVWLQSSGGAGGRWRSSGAASVSSSLAN